jgi:hypothetical protein
MKRRAFIKTAGSIAAATTVITTAGCMDIGSGSGNSGPNIDVTITTSDQFDEWATHTDPSITVEETGSDDETRPVVKYQIEATDDSCVHVNAFVRAVDSDGVVIGERTVNDGFEPGSAYEVNHVINADPSNVSEIKIELTVDRPGIQCFV